MSFNPQLQPELEQATARLIGALRWRLMWRYTGRWLAIVAWGLGCVWLLLRVLGQLPAQAWTVGLVLLLLTPGLGWWLAQRRRFTKEEAAAWLDQGSGGAGFVLLAAERPGPSYAQAVQGQLVRATELPRANAGRELLRALPALGFALLALLVPVSGGDAPGSDVLAEHVVERAEELAQRLEALDEVVELDAEQRAELDQRLERLMAAQPELEMEAAFEGLDRLEAELERSAQEASAAAEQALESVAKSAGAGFADLERAQAELARALEQLAQGGLEPVLGEQTRSDLERLLAELGSLAELVAQAEQQAKSASASKSGASGAGATGAGAPDAGDSGQGAEISPELAQRLAEMAEAMAKLDAELRQALAEALAKLDAAGLKAGGPLDLTNLRPIDEALARALLEALQREDHSQCEHAPGGT
jgi:hypothetical protein